MPPLRADDSAWACSKPTGPRALDASTTRQELAAVGAVEHHELPAEAIAAEAALAAPIATEV